MDNFISKIQKQLQIMSEKEKDQWILSQARIIPQWKQEDFYKSICGTKKIINMPDRQEIDEFCEKVRNGDIFVEYETHYVEFDDYGYFHDDWEYDFYDPFGAMEFFSSVVRGCHDLILLEEYLEAYEILEKLIGLKFTIEDHPDTDDSCEDEFLDLHDAVREGLLSVDISELLEDYTKACRNTEKDMQIVAEKIVSALETELFQKCKMDDCMSVSDKDPLLGEIKKTLAGKLAKAEKEFYEKCSKDRYYYEKYQDESYIKRIKKLIDYFAGIGKKEEEPKDSFLRGTWQQIKGLLGELELERYIDDQYQIGEIWKIVEALIKRGGFEKEPWEEKEKILREIYDNEFFDYYGVYDPMSDLANAICSDREENLKRAGIMMQAKGGYFGSAAAKLYRELGEEEKCVEYFERHLGKEEEPYEIVMNHYKDLDHAKAVKTAQLAIEKCKNDQTPFYIFLLQDAKDRGDEAGFKKLLQSAHRRRAVKSWEVDEVFS